MPFGSCWTWTFMLLSEMLSSGDIAALAYLWNPLTIVTCVGSSTSPFENLVVVLSLYGACRRKKLPNIALHMNICFLSLFLSFFVFIYFIIFLAFIELMLANFFLVTIICCLRSYFCSLTQVRKLNCLFVATISHTPVFLGLSFQSSFWVPHTIIAYDDFHFMALSAFYVTLWS